MGKNDATRRRVTGKPGIYRRGRLYRIYFRDAGEIVRWRSGFTTVDDAVHAREEVVRLAGEGVRLPGTRVRLVELVEDWLENGRRAVVRGTLSQGTLRRYEKVVDGHIGPHFGDRLVRNIDRFDIAELVEHLRTRGLAESSRGLVLKTLGQIMDFGVASGAHGYNPVVEYRRHQTQPREQRLAGIAERVRVLSTEEVARLLSVASAPWQAAFTLMTFTGMTTGELLVLRWRDVDVDRRQMTVRLMRRSDGTVDELLDARRRDVPLSEPTLETLDMWRGTTPFGTPDDPVFPNRVGGLRTPRSLDLAFRQAADHASLGGGVTASSLRHTYAATLIAEQVDCDELARRLGHASFESTIRTYGQLFAAAGRIEEAQQARRAVSSPPNAAGPDVDVVLTAPGREPR